MMTSETLREYRKETLKKAGEFCRNWRKNKGVSVKDLAAGSPYEPNNIYSLEAGNSANYLILINVYYKKFGADFIEQLGAALNE